MPARPHAPQLHWPWRQDTNAVLNVEGDVFFPAILEAVAEARQRIDLEIYMCSSGEVFEQWLAALSAAAARGVQVRMLIDDAGSEQLSAADRDRLQQVDGITLRVFNPIRFGHPSQALIRDHRKLVVVDGERAWTGGMGLDDHYSQRLSGDQSWLDAMVQCEGQLAADWQELFEQAWALAGRGPIKGAYRWRLYRQHIRQAVQERPQHAPAARVIGARGGRRNPILHVALQRLDQAQQQIWLCTPYFLPPRLLMRALERAALRGVKVHLMLCGPHSDHPPLRYAGQHLYQRLIDVGVEIYEYDRRFIHLKAIRADQWCSLGSFNFDRWNSSWNLEANAEWDGEPALLADLERLQQQLEHEAMYVDPRRWELRNLRIQTQQALMYWVGTRGIKLLRRWRGD